MKTNLPEEVHVRHGDVTAGLNVCRMYLLWTSACSFL